MKNVADDEGQNDERTDLSARGAQLRNLQKEHLRQQRAGSTDRMRAPHELEGAHTDRGQYDAKRDEEQP